MSTGILIADDHAIVRDGLRQLLGLFDDLAVESEVGDGEAVVDALSRRQFDLVLLDMSMPGLSGIELIAHIKAHHPGQRILVLSMHREPGVALRALAAGAQGYVSKDSDSTTLVDAIRRVAAGDRFLDPAIRAEDPAAAG